MRCHRRIRSGASKFIIFFSRIPSRNAPYLPSVGENNPPPIVGVRKAHSTKRAPDIFHLIKGSMGRHAIGRKGNVIPVQNSLECEVFSFPFHHWGSTGLRCRRSEAGPPTQRPGASSPPPGASGGPPGTSGGCRGGLEGHLSCLHQWM